MTQHIHALVSVKLSNQFQPLLVSKELKPLGLSKIGLKLELYLTQLAFKKMLQHAAIKYHTAMMKISVVNQLLAIEELPTDFIQTNT